jgi:hypothetical protein
MEHVFAIYHDLIFSFICFLASSQHSDRKPGTPLKDLDFDRKLLLSDSQKQTLREIIQRDAKVG